MSRGAGTSEARIHVVVAAAMVVVAAIAVRLWPVAAVFGPDGVHVVGGGDAEYHLLRAQVMAASWPRVLWVDPYLDFPRGALIPWPPLLDQLVSTAAVITGDGADAGHVARVAALVPVVLSALTALLLVPLSRALIGGAGWSAAFIASMLPAVVGYGFVGLADQHALELLLWCAAVWAYVVGFRTGARSAAAGLGVALALAFWNWPGSGAYLMILSAHAALAHVVEPGGPESSETAERTLLVGGGVAAAALAASVAALAPAGALRRMSIVSVGGLAVVLCAAMALGAGLLLVSHRMRRGRARVGRRVAEVALAGAIAGAAVASIPGVLAGVRQGLAAAGAANAWYRTITEFWPLIGSGFVPLQRELVYPVAFFGLGFLVLPLAAIGLRREWVERPDRRGALLFLWGWCAVSLVASLARTRFMLYLAVPLAVCAAAWLERVARRAGSRAELAIAAGAMAIVAPAYAFYQKPAPATDAPLLETVRWIADAELRNARPGAVLAPWTNGHAVRAAGLPVVGSPFGTDVSARSLEDEAAFFCTFSSEEARAIADERRVDFVIVRQPIDVVWSLQDLRPRPDRRGADGVAAPLVTEVHSTWAWMRLDPGAEFSRTIMARLFYGDGMASRRHAEPALGWVRLVREEFAPEPSGLPDVRQTKTFSVVRGALLRVDGARPGAAVLASARITTNVGRAFVWTTQATADATGSASLRVPYATGANGTSSALAYEVRDGEQQATVNVAEAAVTTGSEIVVALSGARGSRPRGAPDR